MIMKMKENQAMGGTDESRLGMTGWLADWLTIRI